MKEKYFTFNGFENKNPFKAIFCMCVCVCLYDFVVVILLTSFVFVVSVCGLLNKFLIKSVCMSLNEQQKHQWFGRYFIYAK